MLAIEGFPGMAINSMSRLAALLDEVPVAVGLAAIGIPHEQLSSSVAGDRSFAPDDVHG
jgi:hypothetical protein